MENYQSHHRQELRDGFVAAMVLWPADIPAGIAQAVLAQINGFTKPEAIFTSLFVLAGSAQLAIID